MAVGPTTVAASMANAAALLADGAEQLARLWDAARD
jgi:hypothetical protein